MTTPKELAEEFRRIATKAEGNLPTGAVTDFAQAYKGGISAGVQMAMEQAAQMVEERLK